MLGVAAAGVCLCLSATLLWPPRPLLLWNASASSPIGLYAVSYPPRLRAGDTVIAWPPPPARRLAGERHYLPVGVPMVKPLAAISGARVCAIGRIVSIEGRPAASRRLRDRAGRQMPWWSGCRRLRPGELFLLAPDACEAFDGRYFGITRASEVIGKGTLLWRG